MRRGELVLQALAMPLPPARPGAKHLRPIVFQPWQQEIALEAILTCYAG